MILKNKKDYNNFEKRFTPITKLHIINKYPQVKVLKKAFSIKLLRMEDVYEISGLLFKRRGGFGKMMPNAWQQRYFIITKDGILYYYDTDNPDALKHIGDTKPRGKLDLKFCMHDLTGETIPEPGAPTQNLISLVPPNEERWKLCAASKDDYLKWTKCLDKFTSQSTKNLGRSSVVLPDNVAYASDDENGGKRLSGIGKQSTETVTQSQMKNTTAVMKASKGRIKLKSNKSSATIDLFELILTLCIMNLCLYIAYLSQHIIPRISLLILANFVVGSTLINRSHRYNKVINRNNNNNEVQSATIESAISATSNELIITEKPLFDKNTAPLPGSTFTEVKTPPKSSPSHTWCRIDPKQFHVRIGPDYNRFKKKAPSAGFLYEPFAVDVFCTRRRLDHAATRFKLPEDILNINTYNPHVPPVFITQIQIPSEPPPSLFTTVEDGPGWAILMFFKITQDTIDQFKDPSKLTPAAKLFAQYCEKSQEDPLWRARFKVICACANLDELGVPPLVMSYNAKPVLIRRTGSDFKGKGYLEKNIHVHKFATMAKQTIHSLSSRCGLMYMQIGFVIEGRLDEELPETLISCVAINKPQEDHAGFLFDDY